MSRRDALLLGAVVAAAAALRAPGLALPHDRGDQLIWAGVARNISGRGAAGYTLRGLDSGFAPIGDGAAIQSFSCVEGRGAILEEFMAEGEKYWDAPLVNQPPGFFALLLASHALLGTAGDGFPLVAKDPAAYAAFLRELVQRSAPAVERRRREIALLPEAERARATGELDAELFEEQGTFERGLARALVACPPPGSVRVQLWATLPVLLADLGTVALVFAFARRLGGRAAAAIAGLVWACDPIALFCSTRVLSNAPLAFACALALGLEVLASERRSRWLSLAVGAACAAAISIKVSAVFLLPAIALGRLLRKESYVELALLLGIALVAAVPWWLLQWHVLGHPFGFAWRNQPDRLKVSHWGQLVMGRGAIYYAETLIRSPLLLAGAAAGALAWRKHATPLAFSVAVIAAAARFEEKEARHLLLAYPPLAVAAGVGIAKMAEKAKPISVAVAVIVLGAVLVREASAGRALAFDVGRVP